MNFLPVNHQNISRRNIDQGWHHLSFIGFAWSREYRRKLPSQNLWSVGLCNEPTHGWFYIRGLPLMIFSIGRWVVMFGAYIILWVGLGSQQYAALLIMDGYVWGSSSLNSQAILVWDVVTIKQYPNNRTTTKFCRCHDSSAVVASVKLCCDHNRWGEISS